jgi:tRNA A-37 threonylcarbamoyl transferase component Bud32
MEQSSDENKTHVLNLTYDNEDTCALTALVNDVRFHIIVDPKDLQKSREKPLYYEYLDKISGLRDAEQREEERAEEQRAVGKTNKKDRSNDKDSAVDMTSDEESDEDQDSGSAAVELRNWILSAFTDVTAECAPPNREPIDSTLHDWYHGPTYFYSLQIKAGALSPELLETTDDLTARINALVPRLTMPKYIQSIDLPWHSAASLTVHSEVSLPEPAHPGKVSDASGNTYFFKPVVSDQPGTAKREINILQKIAKLDLDIKVPRLLGFVSYDGSSTQIMGFLLSHIASPTPLTNLLNRSVPRAKRAEWATKCESYVKLLHDNDIIWGDAKADNFMVDEDDELWIIDFGGSYTEGWVDPEISETREGDDMGVGKVVRALEDPEGETVGVETTEGGSEVRETASGLFVTERVEGGKRKREVDDVNEEEEDDGGNKRRKESESGDGSGDEYTEE